VPSDPRSRTKCQVPFTTYLWVAEGQEFAKDVNPTFDHTLGR